MQSNCVFSTQNVRIRAMQCVFVVYELGHNNHLWFYSLDNLDFNCLINSEIPILPYGKMRKRMVSRVGIAAYLFNLQIRDSYMVL